MPLGSLSSVGNYRINNTSNPDYNPPGYHPPSAGYPYGRFDSPEAQHNAIIAGGGRETPDSVLWNAINSPAPSGPSFRQTQNQTALAQGYFQGLYGPQLADIQTQRDRYTGQLGMLEATTADQIGNLRTGYGLDLQSLGLQGKGIGVERQGINQQLGQVGQLEELARQLYGVQRQGFDLDVKQLRQQKGVAKRGAFSDATARGAVTTPGMGQALTDIRNEYLTNLREIGLERRQAGLGFKKEMTGYQGQRLDLQNRNKMLDIRSQQLGIDRKQLANNLEQGINRLNLDKWVGTNEILDGLQSADLQERMLSEQIFRSALEYSDFFGVTSSNTSSANRRGGRAGASVGSVGRY